MPNVGAPFLGAVARVWIFISFAVVSYGNTDTEFRFDVDQDGQSDALVDGLLVLRHLFGFTGHSGNRAAGEFAVFYWFYKVLERGE